MKTRFGDFNAGLQVAPTEASAVLYEHPFPSLYSLLSCIYSPYFVYSGSDQICLFTVSIKYHVRPAGRQSTDTRTWRKTVPRTSATHTRHTTRNNCKSSKSVTHPVQHMHPCHTQHPEHSDKPPEDAHTRLQIQTTASQ